MVIIMLPDMSDLEAVVRGPDGLVTVDRRELLLIDMITVDPIATVQIGQELASKGSRSSPLRPRGRAGGGREDSLDDGRRQRATRGHKLCLCCRSSVEGSFTSPRSGPVTWPRWQTSS